KWESDEMGASKLNPLSRGDSSLMLTQLSTAKATSRDNKVAHPLRLTQPANRERMNLTSAQQEAIGARGNVLVIAGAGTGKTRTLVERCLSCLLDEKHPASLDEILMVTFTEAAAAEMRQRI